MADLLEVSIVVFVMLSVSPAAASNTGIFSILDDSYIQNVSELPYSAGVPDKNIQSSGHIWGWIDIVGFRDVARMNGVDYINGSPADKAIIQYDAWGEKVSVDSVTRTITVSLSRNNTNAKMDVILKWHYYYSCNCNKNGCSTCRKDVVESATFYDDEKSPTRIENGNINIKAIVRERNFSIINTTDISIEIDDSVYDRYLIKTDYGFYEKINRMWHVEKTAKDVNYANETKLDIFKSENISHSQNIIVVDDSNTNFSLAASGFYFSTNKTNITKVYEVSNPTEQFFCGDLLGFLAVLLCFGVFYKYTLR